MQEILISAGLKTFLVEGMFSIMKGCGRFPGDNMSLEILKSVYGEDIPNTRRNDLNTHREIINHIFDTFTIKGHKLSFETPVIKDRVWPRDEFWFTIV